MRNFLALLAFALLTLAAVGWYRGWYEVRREPAKPGHQNVEIDIDTNKIGDDLHKGGQKVQDLIEKARKERERRAAEDAAKAEKDKPAVTPH